MYPKTYRRTILFFTMATLFSGCVTNSGEPQALRKASQATLEELGTSALTVAVFDSAEILETVTLGTVSRDSAEAVGDTAAWHLGSCTKAMTATLIGRLVDRGVLEFSTTIGEVFGDESISADFANVPLELLLRHHGGTTGSISVSHPTVWLDMWRNAGNDDRVVRRNAVLEILKDPPSGRIGAYTYSNAGFLIAAAMAEERTGESWADLMRSELFAPLGMKRVGFGPALEEAPWPHTWDGAGYVPVDPRTPQADNPPSLGPAGTVHATIEDWVSFLQVFIGGGPAGYLESATLKELLRPADSGVSGANPQAAAGWFVVDREWAGGLALNHDGSNNMNFAVVWLAPEKRRGIVIATNGFSPDTREIADGLAAWMITRYIAPVE